jgi:hypothetical protein
MLKYSNLVYFQLRDTLTAFFAGFKDPRRIMTYDLTENNYTVHSERLIGKIVSISLF